MAPSTPLRAFGIFRLNTGWLTVAALSIAPGSAALSSARVSLIELLRIGVLELLAGQWRDVFNDRAGHRHRRGDHRLRFLVEVDQLRVAAVLEIGDTTAGPDVLIVADQLAIGIGRERGLAGAGE